MKLSGRMGRSLVIFMFLIGIRPNDVKKRLSSGVGVNAFIVYF
jgi:hypothetical protein